MLSREIIQTIIFLRNLHDNETVHATKYSRWFQKENAYEL